MCGRYSLTADDQEIAKRFHVTEKIAAYKPRYNIAPAQDCLTIVSTRGIRIPKFMHWGIIPRWTKNSTTQLQVINARAESLLQKPTFRKLLHTHRCIIPASGFFEWGKTAFNKTPFYTTVYNRNLISFAGLWDEHIDESGKQITSFTIITTEANEKLALIHDRMPVILSQEAETKWLNQNIKEYSQLEPLLKPYKANDIEIYPVSPLVNSWKNDIPECIQKVSSYENTIE